MNNKYGDIFLFENVLTEIRFDRLCSAIFTLQDSRHRVAYAMSLCQDIFQKSSFFLMQNVKICLISALNSYGTTGGN